MSQTWNPRYLAYCRAHGQSDPAKQLDMDAERWPGGVMCGFILWMMNRLSEFNALQGCRNSEICHLELGNRWDSLFDAMLDEKYPRQKGDL